MHPITDAVNLETKLVFLLSKIIHSLSLKGKSKMWRQTMKTIKCYRKALGLFLTLTMLLNNGLSIVFAQDSDLDLPRQVFLPIVSSSNEANLASSAQPGELDMKNDAQKEKPPVGGLEVSPGMFNAIEEWSNTEKGSIKLLDFVEKNWPELAKEATLLQEHFQRNPRGSGCACDIVYAYELSPEEVRYDEELLQNDTNWPTHFIEWSYSEQGAAHWGKIYRSTKGGGNTTNIQTQENKTVLETRILCEDTDGNECVEGLCTAQLDFRVRYGSQVRVTTKAQGWPFSNGSVAVAANVVRLSHNPPGSGTPELELMAKGHGVNYSQSTNLDVDHFVGLLQSAAGIAIAFLITETNTIGQVPDMVDEGITHLAHLYNKTGNGHGDERSEMLATYDTAQNDPITMISGESYLLDLTSVGSAQSRGYGPFSRGTGEYGSSYSLAAAIHHAQCQDGTDRPPDFGFASYSYQNGPTSLTEYTLCRGIENYMWVTLGDLVDCDEYHGGGFNGTGSHVHATGGRFIPPPLPPIAACTVSPEWGVGHVTSTFNGNGSYDPDGSIVEYKWTVSNINSPLFGSGPHTRNFNAAGNDELYTLHLRVTDNSGLTDIATCTVEVMCEDSSNNSDGFFCMH